jgi:hypothetical protein
MQKSFITFLLILIVVIILFPGCAPQYDFSISPPYVNARMNEVFPESIRNSPGTTIKEILPDDRFQGYTVTYLDQAITFTVIKCLDKELTFEELLVRKEPTKAALEYFNSTIREKFYAMPIHTFGEKAGFRQATGKDKEGRSWLAWVNSLWVFILSGKDNDHFKLAVRACRFVAKVVNGNKWVRFPGVVSRLKVPVQNQV